jgi:predicted small secreted protein
MKKIMILLIICITLFISGCETMHGLGRDFENLGNWMQQK